MILADTSVWIDHLRLGDSEMVTLLDDEQIVMHPFIIGELACGYLKQREEVLMQLQRLPQLAVVTEEEVLYFIEQHELMGKGIGYIDAHLLAAVTLNPRTRMWTRDGSMEDIASALQMRH